MIAKERDFDNDLSITWKPLIPRLVPNPLKGKLPVYFPSTSLGPRQDLRQHVRKYRGIAAITYLPTDEIMHFFFCIANDFAQLRVKYITELSCKAEGIAQEQIQGRGLKVPPGLSSSCVTAPHFTRFDQSHINHLHVTACAVSLQFIGTYALLNIF